MDRRLPPLLVAVFINIAGFSLILPLLPFYGQVFGAGPFEIALLFAAYSFGNVFGEIHWGRQSDVWGRRKVLVVTTFLAGLSYLAFAYAPTLWAAIAIRVVSGFFSGTLSTAQGFIADVSAPACPWLIVQGEEDEVVDANAVFEWAAALQPPVQLIRMPETGHFFHRRLMDLRGALKNALGANLPPARA